nr:hypothetical protein B0A51_04187 [Rachicladosporium sp. CCFEE 5018]
MSAPFRCLCGKISGTVTGTDKGAVLCHCPNCRRFTGSAFAHNQRYTKASIAYTTPSRPKVYRDSDTKSGVTLKRSFCADCGSSIFIESEAVEGLVIVHCGVIDDAEARKPKFELFGEERRGWVGDVGSGKAKM